MTTGSPFPPLRRRSPRPASALRAPTRPFPLAGLALVALPALLVLPACRSREEAAPRPAAAEQRFPLTGVVMSRDLVGGEARVAHDAIPGFMDAMTMSFAVRPREALNDVEPGDRIRATLVVAGARSWLEGVSVTEKVKPGEAPKPEPGSRLKPPAQPGDEVPPFSLVDQAGRPVTRETFRGKVVVATFFFTRCPLPDYCPRMNGNLGRIERAVVADPSLARKVRLLSVSFDPERDTPEVLKEYGLRYHDAASGPPFAIWTFASGSAEEVRKLTDFFGVWVEKKGESFDHGLVTSVIDGEGRVVTSFFGNSWQPEEVLAEARKAAGRTAG